MKVVLREDESGVSEVVGTILILAMTVVLFSTIIIWVSSIPTPVAQTRVDIQGNLIPRYGPTGLETGDWVNLTHQGGESMPAASTVMYISDQKGVGAPTTAVIHIASFRTYSGSLSYGMLDGSGQGWSVGQRFSYFNASLRSSDNVTVTIVDLTRSTVMWNAQLNPPAGTRPPVFLNTWASQSAYGTPITPVTGKGFYVLAQVMSPDNRVASVTATLTFYYGRAGFQNCAVAKPLFDNGANGDASANDGTFTLYDNSCTGTAYSGMDGSLVLLNATDVKGHVSTTRMVLHVLPGSGTQNPGGNQTPQSGRPNNLLWNGNQGYNIFNASQWDIYGYGATATRTFRANETVVLVVGSLTLENVFSSDSFSLWNTYSNPVQPVVYGTQKTVGSASQPSTTSAFSFFQFLNGYYIYTYRFPLNTATQTNFYLPPSNLVPPNYLYGKYPLSIGLGSSTGNVFTAADSINITTTGGQTFPFPQITTYSDPYFQHPTTFFMSTATMYVRVRMPVVESNTSIAAGTSTVVFGNIIIQDFSGSHQLYRAPANGYLAFMPICPVSSACSGSAIWSVSASGGYYYEFSVNLARVNQDPWVPGVQNYAFIISSVHDMFNTYSNPSIGISVQSPLYKMDIAAGFAPSMNSAWGTFDYARFYQDYNGYDAWKQLRVDYCVGTSSISGMNGTGSTCPGKSQGQDMPIKARFGDLFNSGHLDLVESAYIGSTGVVEIYRYTTDATGAVVYLPVKRFYQSNDPCTAVAVGDVTGDGSPDVVCGGYRGDVWYYRNDGNWTTVYVDPSTTRGSATSVAIGDFNGGSGNDIAVAGSGYLRWYPNLNGLGQFRTATTSTLFAGGEKIVNGTIAFGSRFNTYAVDTIYEQLQEGVVRASTGTGNASGLDEYWSFPVMPVTATSFTLSFTGYRSVGSDSENFTLAYSTNVAGGTGGDPTTGTYTKVITVSSSTSVLYTALLTGVSGGQTVWIRAEDTNRTGGALGMESLYVDQIYISATSTASTGVALGLPVGSCQVVNSISAGDQDKDGFADLVAGTNGGCVYKYTGSLGGLQSPTGAFFTTPGGANVIGVRWGNFTMAYPGLEIAVAAASASTGAVYIIPGSSFSTSTIISTLSSASPISAFGVGDINGDLRDDVVIGTSSGLLILWENLGAATSWTPPVTIDNIGAQYYSLTIGDTLNSQYMGR